MVRFGIVGFGLHAIRRMLHGFELAKECQVTALTRRSMANAQESARQYNIPHAFDSVEALCRCPEVDAVFVTTPNACHLQDVLTAVQYRKPVLCEKPMAMNSAECRQMVEAARKARVLLGIAQVFRFTETVTRMRERLAAGLIGKPVLARCEFTFMAKEDHPRTWLHDRALAGGGPIADIGVHCIDTLRYILQDEVVRVSARGARDSYSRNVEASAILTLEFSRGTLGAALVSFRTDYRSPLEIVGNTGVLRADDGLNIDRPVNLHLRREGVVVESETLSNQYAYARQVDVFAAAVQGHAEFPVPGEEGWQNQEILDAAYRSLESGKTEEVPRVR